ncbi:MAG: peptide-N-glycosidase F-related protein [Phycisphaerales bacterium]
MNIATRILVPQSASALLLALLAVFAGLVNAGQRNQHTHDARADSTDIVETVWVSMRAKVPEPAEMGEAMGFGIVLVDESLPMNRKAIAWDEPNVDYGIGIGFDVHNPQPTDLEPDENGRIMGWFDSMGNWYDRPQREVSVHAYGRERINTLSSVEFRTGQWVDVMVQLRYELGGAHVVVMIDGSAVIDQMIWDVEPMSMNVIGGVVGDQIQMTQPKIVHEVQLDEQLPQPVRVQVFDEALLTNAAWLKSEIDFSEVPEQVGRVIATLTLGEPEVGYDHWDKKGTIGLRLPSTVDEEGNEIKGERFEVFRFITPFRKGWTWHMDVTDLLPLFKDLKEFDAHIGTYMKGWLVSFDLDFYPGTPEREPISVVNLWNGNADIGDTDKPVEEFYVDREIQIPDGATHARVRATVTGHGMLPNSKNAGEFMPIWRTMTIRSGESEGDVLGGDSIMMSERNHLWKTDVYLNPCRPQGGTWKFDRAGWSPGDKVEPWIVDVQPEFVFGDVLTIEYELDEYINEGKGQTWAPHHWTDAVVVFYK